MARQLSISVDFSEEQAQQVSAAAAVAQLPVKVYIRKAALLGPDPVNVADQPRISKEELRTLRQELDRAHKIVGFFKCPALERSILITDRLLKAYSDEA